MKKPACSRRLQVLDHFQKFISEATKTRKSKLGMTYIEARESILEQLGWRNGYEFSKWKLNELDKAQKIENCPVRQSCIFSREQPEDNPVYIFDLKPELYFYGKDEITHNIKDLPCILETEFDTVLKTSMSLNLDSTICNIWDAHQPAPQNLANLEWRKADCSCRRNYALACWDGSRMNPEVYILKNKEHITRWASEWGGIACFEESVLELLDDNHPIKNCLTAPYLVRRLL